VGFTPCDSLKGEYVETGSVATYLKTLKDTHSLKDLIEIIN